MLSIAIVPVIQGFSLAIFAQDTQAHPSRQGMGLPRDFQGGADLPNGWRITPAGKPIATMGDMVTNLVASPDGRVVVAVNSGFLPHGIDVFDVKTRKRVQHIELSSTWLGMVWAQNGHTLYASGGNGSGFRGKKDAKAAIYEFTYMAGRLSETPVGELVESIDPKLVWWSGLAYLPTRHLLYAANRGTGTGPSNVVVFDTKARQIITRIRVGVTPYQVVLSADGKRLFVSNWSSESVSVIDTETNRVIRTVVVGMNPNDMKISADGRLFVACSNDNTVDVIDTRTLRVIERLSTTQTPLAPEGSTPDALAIDDKRKLLYIANADNNSIAVAHIDTRAHSAITGFIPTGWYPSALVLRIHNDTLFIGNVSTPIQHVIYIIKENRTYDQVFGDLPHANGDLRLTIFGEKITPNQHALGREYVILDNLYCDGEVSVDGHSWSNSAYATDFNKKAVATLLWWTQPCFI
jgi:YVTN family beta-propeller protein